MLDIAWINDSALFLHVVAALFLTAGGVVQVAAGTRVRQATTGEQLASWARFARSVGPVTVVAAALSLFTGGHLAGVKWGFENAFVTLGTVALVVLAPVGPMLGGARLRRLAEAGEAVGGGHLDETVRTQASHPVLWGAVHSLVGISIGFVWIMTNKPGWAATALVLVGTFGIGWASGVVLARRDA